MATQWIKALTTKSDNLSLIFRSHAIEGKNRLPKVVI